MKKLAYPFSKELGFKLYSLRVEIMSIKLEHLDEENPNKNNKEEFNFEINLPENLHGFFDRSLELKLINNVISINLKNRIMFL